MTEESQFSLGVSIVLYKTPLSHIAPLLTDLQKAGAAKIFVIDNSPPPVDTDDGFALSNVVERYRTGKNLGFGRAQNIGIRLSIEKYKYHLICNPDITLSDGAISSIIDFMEADPAVGLCMPRLVGPDGETQFCCRRSPVALDYISQLLLPRSWGKHRRDALEMRTQNYDERMEVQCLSGCFMVFRSDVLRRLGGFDERFFLYFEDFDLSLRSQRLAKNIYFPSTHVVHERQSAHRRSWWLRAVFAMSAFRYFAKWGWFSSRAPMDASINTCGP
jgi:GT2 family glycosyltransferase